METNEKSKTSLVPFALYVVMVVFGWWVPNDLLETSPNLAIFTDFMASIVPQIDRVTELGGATAGNANRFIYAILWVINLLLSVLCLILVVSILRARNDIDHLSLLRIFDVQIWMLPLASLVGMYLFYESMYMGHLHFGMRLVNIGFVYRFSASIWAPILSVAPVISGFGSLLSLLVFFIYLNKFIEGLRNE